MTTETKQNETIEVSNVIQEIPRISDTEADQLISEKIIGKQDNKVIIYVTELELFLKLQTTCEEEMYFFVGGLFRTVPSMNAYPVGTKPADRKNLQPNPFKDKIVKYSRSVGRTDFEWAKVKGNAEKKLGLEPTEIKERVFGTKIGETATVIHTLKDTDKTRGYIAYNFQRSYESFYVWAETGTRLTDAEVAELKTYLPVKSFEAAIYRNYRTNTILWLNTNGKKLIVKDIPSDKDFLANDIKEEEEIKAQRKANKKPPSL
jgi:hypothetical protein